MTNTPPILPPEVVRIVASYMDRQVLLALGMTNRFCAGLFAGIYYNDWRVQCCGESEGGVVTDLTKQHYATNLESFYRGLKRGLAPAYAKRVWLEFCMHTKSARHLSRNPNRSTKHDPEAEKLQQRHWPMEDTDQLFELLNASEIIVVLKTRDKLRHICNLPLVEAALRKALSALPKAVVKLQVDTEATLYARKRIYYITVRDSSTSQATVDDNLQRAIGQIRPSSREDDVWDAAYIGGIDNSIYKDCVFPNIKHLTLPVGTGWSGYENSFYLKPELVLTMFPKCQVMTEMELERGVPKHSPRVPKHIYYFDSVSGTAHERRCTKILVHGRLHEWVSKIMDREEYSSYIKIIEFHHFNLKYGPQCYTLSQMKVILSCLLKHLPNLETITLKFDASFNVPADPNYLGRDQTLARGFCQRNTHSFPDSEAGESESERVRCKLGLNVREFGIQSMRREGQLLVGSSLAAAIKSVGL